ncbi:MAG: hypothetical protein V4662_24030 [Verrucomicrobiota bacterium]
MNEEDLQAHMHLIRQHWRMAFCRHVVLSTASVHEWYRVRMKLTVFQRLLPHLIFTLFIGFMKRGDSTLHTIAVMAGVAVCVELVLRYYFHGGGRELVLDLDTHAGVLCAPLAGLEIDAAHLEGFALRKVRHLMKRRNNLVRHPQEYVCFYARTVDGRFHVLAAHSATHERFAGFQTAARRLAEASHLPLMEPEEHQDPVTLRAEA